MIRFGVIAAILLLIAVIGVTSVKEHKHLVGLQKKVDSSWNELAGQYQHRGQVISDLAQRLAAEPGFDQTLLTQLSQARDTVNAITLNPNQAPTDATQFQKYVQAQDALNKALSQVLRATLKSPALMADQKFRAVQSEMLESENRLAIKQNRFDQDVQGYNAKVHHFPVAIEAFVLGFKSRPSFQTSR